MLKDLLNFIPKIPIAEGTEKFTKLLTDKLAFLFNPVKKYFGEFMSLVSDLLAGIPPVIVIILIALIAFFISGKRLGLAAFAVFGLWLIDNQGLWSQFIDTFTLVLIASLLRSEEHTSELQSRCHLVCSLLLVKKK